MVETRFGRTEQENLRRQAVRAAGNGLGRAAAFAVREFYLLDGVLDVRLEQVQERAVQVGVDGAVGVIVSVRAMALAVFVDVLHQQPSTVAAIVIDAGRLALMDDDEIFGRTIYFQLDGAADCFGTQGHISHKKEPPVVYYIHGGMLSGRGSGWNRSLRGVMSPLFRRMFCSCFTRRKARTLLVELIFLRGFTSTPMITETFLAYFSRNA